MHSTTVNVAPFLMALLKDIAMDAAIFATSFTDDVVVEVECIDSED
jgi:hypothetical protein